MLKRTLTAEQHSALAEPLQALYASDGNDGFVLQADPDPRVAEFRNNNLALKKQLEAKEKKPAFRPEDASMADQLNELRGKYAAMEAKEAKATAAATRAALQTRIAETGKRLGIQASAMRDVMFRAEDAGFTVKDGAPVALDPEGNVVANGDTPLTLGAWLADLKENGGDHLFAKPSGTTGGWNANGKTQGGAKRVAFDMTPEAASAHIDAIASGELALQDSGGGI